jgi:hypothetical protein
VEWKSTHVVECEQNGNGLECQRNCKVNKTSTKWRCEYVQNRLQELPKEADVPIISLLT